MAEVMLSSSKHEAKKTRISAAFKNWLAKEPPAATQRSFCELVRNGKLAQVKAALTQAPPLADSFDEHGVPVLIVAIEEQLPIISRVLVKAGANPTQRCRNVHRANDTPLMVSLRHNRPFITRVLVERYLDRESQDTFLSIRELLGMQLFEGAQENHKTTLRRQLVQVYADMSIDKLVHGVPRNFVAAPAQTLLDLLTLAASTMRMSIRLRVANPAKSADLATSSNRIQLAAAGCLRTISTLKDGLGRYECDEILSSPLGLAALAMALKNKGRAFLTQPEAQAYFRREWRGALLEELGSGGGSLREGVALAEHVVFGALRFIAAYLLNLIALPLVACVPPLEMAVYEFLRTRDLHRRTQAVRERTKRRRTKSTPLHSLREAAEVGQKIATDAAGVGQKIAMSAQRSASQFFVSRRSGRVVQVEPSPAAPAPSGIAHSRVEAAANSPWPVTGKEPLNNAPAAVWASGRTDDSAPPPSLASQESRETPWPESPRVQHVSAWPSAHAPKDLKRSKSSLGANGAAQHTILDWWLFRTPVFKFSTSMLSDFVIACLVSFLPLADDRLPLYADDKSTMLLRNGFLLWAIGGCLFEYRQIARNKKELTYELLSFLHADIVSLYRRDVFNLLDLAFYHVLLIATLLPERTRGLAGCWSFAAFLSWLRLMRVLQLSSSVGPLILMLTEMVRDVVELVAISVFVLLAFTFGTLTLFNAFARDRANQGMTSLEAAGVACEPFVVHQGSFASDKWWQMLFVLANGFVSGENHASCFLAIADGWFEKYAWVYSFAFLLVTNVLLLNMLIAMMAKTFDNVWEASEVRYQFVFATMVFMQSHREPEPPPLNILRLPWNVLYILATLIEPALPRSCGAVLLQRFIVWFDAGFDSSPYVDHRSPFANNLCDDDEYKGTFIAGRNTFTNWKRSMTEKELRQLLSEFVESRQDDQATEERWRTHMLKRITSSHAEGVRRLEKRLEQQQASLEEMQAAMLRQEAVLRTLLGARADASPDEDSPRPMQPEDLQGLIETVPMDSRDEPQLPDGVEVANRRSFVEVANDVLPFQ